MDIGIKIQILADFGSNFTSFFKWSTSEMQVYLISEYFDQFSVLNSLFVIFKQIICHILFSIFEKFISEIPCILIHEFKKLDFRDNDWSKTIFSRSDMNLQILALNFKCPIYME